MKEECENDSIHPSIRIARSLESIADSLQKISNPPIVVNGEALKDCFVEQGNVFYCNGK